MFGNSDNPLFRITIMLVSRLYNTLGIFLYLEICMEMKESRK